MTGDALAVSLTMLGDAGAPVCQDGVCLPAGEAAEPARTTSLPPATQGQR
jgi:hypothetical protein